MAKGRTSALQESVEVVLSTLALDLPHHATVGSSGVYLELSPFSTSCTWADGMGKSVLSSWQPSGHLSWAQGGMRGTRSPWLYWCHPTAIQEILSGLGISVIPCLS